MDGGTAIVSGAGPLGGAAWGGGAALRPLAGSAGRGFDFSSVLGRGGAAGPHAVLQSGRGPAGAASTEAGAAEAEARGVAEQLIAVTFVQPALESLRSADGAAEPFKPNEAERAFRALHDAQTALEITRSARFPLVERVVRDVLRTSGGSGDGLRGGASAAAAVGRGLG